MLPSNYKACNILEMRQLLETWYDRCTFAVATWRGDAQRNWLAEILDRARARHDQWLQSSPSQRASLEPAYILGDWKTIPEAQNAVESVLRTELLDAIPKSIAEACMRHGYCTAELIVWYVMKQLIMPHDINEITMQREILTHPKTSPSTLDYRGLSGPPGHVFSRLPLTIPLLNCNLHKYKPIHKTPRFCRDARSFLPTSASTISSSFGFEVCPSVCGADSTSKSNHV